MPPVSPEPAEPQKNAPVLETPVDTPVAPPAPAEESMPYKILLITEDTTLFDERSESHAWLRDISGLADMYFVFVLCDRAHKYQKVNINDRIWIFPTNSLFRFVASDDAVTMAKRELWWHNELHCNLIEAADPFWSAFAAWRISRMLKRPFLVQIDSHMLDKYFYGDRFNRYVVQPIVKFILLNTNFFRVTSKRIVEELARIDPRLAERAIVLPRFLTAAPAPEAVSGADIHKQYHQFNFISLMVAPLKTESRIDVALEVYAKFIKIEPRAGLVIVGEGTELSRLSKMAQKIGIAEHVVFEEGSENASSYLRTANALFVFSHDEEDGDAVLRHALASGCPLITTDSSAVRDHVTEGVSGFVVDINDTEKILQHLHSIYRDPTLRARLKINAVMSIEDERTETKEEYLQKYRATWDTVRNWWKSRDQYL